MKKEKTEVIGSSCNRVVIGLGKTGLSCASYLHRKGLLFKMIDTRTMKLRGTHNHLNALAAMALSEAAGVGPEAMRAALGEFPGLEHRCQWLGEAGGVVWFNDSKATNVGAAVAAVNGLGPDLVGKVILIVGGDSKDADFSDLRPAVEKYVSHVILIGRDASVIGESVKGAAFVHIANDLENAVSLAAELSNFGDAVLLAPACASFDMFENFEDRGRQFVRLVNELVLC